MQYPITARQAQRLLSRKSYFRNYESRRRALREISRALGLPFRDSYTSKRFALLRDTLRELSRIAQQQGPDTIILASPEARSSGESRPKGTDEVAPQSDDPGDGDLHGGDGASGEVKNGSSEGGDYSDEAVFGIADSASGNDGGNSGAGLRSGGAPSSPSTRQSDAGQASDSRAETGDPSTACDYSDDPSSVSGGSKGLRADGQAPPESGVGMSVNRTQEIGGAPNDNGQNPVETGSVTGSFTGRTNATEVADERPDAQAKESGDADGDAASEKYHYRSVKKRSGGGASLSSSAKMSFGGVTAEMSGAGITLGLVRKARAALAPLIEGGETLAGPRWDWVEFTERLKTGRPLQPSRRDEEGRPAILVLADVSGSCSGFSNISLIVAQAIARLGIVGADIVVVSHSNGYPQEWQINGGKPENICLPWGEEALPWYEANLRRFNVEAVVALGDWDAEWLYRHLAELPRVRRLIWLDNYSANYMPPTPNQGFFYKRLRSAWSREAMRKTTYIVGCKDADDFIGGLKLALQA